MWEIYARFGKNMGDYSQLILSLMSGSCHLDRASNVEIGVECQIFVIVIFFTVSECYKGTIRVH